MGLFSFLKKKDNPAMVEGLVSFSKMILNSALADIETHGTFLPFGAVLTTDRKFQMIIYPGQDSKPIDPREHATIIQNIIAKRFQEPNCDFCQMAFDGTHHLPSGDVDAIVIRVSHKATGTHKMLYYHYKVENGKANVLNLDSPIVANLGR
ncbi:MAG: hypothetical protein IT258_15220 [Saprospiraceae bacterium]|nr:hypothetical protein [Saprospiraceae bacterium]